MSQPLRVAISLLAVAIAWSCVQSVETGSVATGFRFDFPTGSPSGRFVPFLASKNGAFAAGGDSSKLVVVGTSINQVNSPLDTIWVANRDLPVQVASSILFDGSLAIVKNPGRDVLWSTGNRGADVLELMDSGNLVMRSTTGSVVWQSFDHPTDTLLEGQNFTRGMKLVSWVSSTNSSSGHYSLQLGTDRMLLYVKLGAADQSSPGEPYWVTAALQEPEALEATKGSMYMRIGDGFMGMYQSETQRVHIVPFSSASLNSSVPRLRRGRVDSDGNFRVYYWQDGIMVEDYRALDGSNPCEDPLACGSYGVCSSSGENKVCECPASEQPRISSLVAKNTSDLNQGCVPRYPPSLCGSSTLDGSSDEFLELQAVDYFANAFTEPLNGSSRSLEQCKANCLKSCSCKAAFFKNDTGSCFQTDQMLSLLASPNTRNTAYIRVANRAEPSRKGSSKKRSVDIALLVLAVLLGAGVGLYFIIRRRKGRFSWNPDEEAFLEHSGQLSKFSYSELKSATNGWADSSKFHIIKVLGLSTSSFKRGVASLQRLSEQHDNIARLAGYCIHGDEHLLVYESLAGGSLADHLRQEKDWGHQLLDWNTKLGIGLGVATGLAFLHAQGLSLRDGGLVARNILLDEQYEPKLSGYFIQDRNGVSSDVRSLGAILLELVGAATDEHEGYKERDREPYWRNRKLLIEAGKHCCTTEQGTTVETVLGILEGRTSALSVG